MLFRCKIYILGQHSVYYIPQILSLLCTSKEKRNDKKANNVNTKSRKHIILSVGNKRVNKRRKTHPCRPWWGHKHHMTRTKGIELITLVLKLVSPWRASWNAYLLRQYERLMKSNSSVTREQPYTMSWQSWMHDSPLWSSVEFGCGGKTPVTCLEDVSQDLYQLFARVAAPP